jgi:ABC-type sugar transport system ATPase subunit
VAATRISQRPHGLIRAADAGAIVVLASTDHEELEELRDRVVFFYRGPACTELTGAVEETAAAARDVRMF